MRECVGFRGSVIFPGGVGVWHDRQIPAGLRRKVAEALRRAAADSRKRRLEIKDGCHSLSVAPAAARTRMSIGINGQTLHRLFGDLLCADHFVALELVDELVQRGASRERRHEAVGAVFLELVQRLGVFRRKFGFRGVGL